MAVVFMYGIWNHSVDIETVDMLINHERPPSGIAYQHYMGKKVK